MTDLVEALSRHLQEIGPAAVAVSGGVDSMTLAVLAHRVNPAITIYHAVSPAVPKQATARVTQYAQQEGWRLHIIDAGEIEDPEYLANPANRCYFCKTNLYQTIVSNTSSLVLSGTNLDDLSDYRPGLNAAEEHQVSHPYVDCAIDKAGLRAVARQLGLEDLQDLPAAPCLSSRVETGIPINPNVLPIINEVEQAIRTRLPESENVRCRIRKSGIVLEIDLASHLTDRQSGQLKSLARSHFTEGGFPELTTVDIEPYLQGSAFLKNNLAVDVTPLPSVSEHKLQT